jgi:hypothetical protein
MIFSAKVWITAVIRFRGKVLVRLRKVLGQKRQERGEDIRDRGGVGWRFKEAG